MLLKITYTLLFTCLLCSTAPLSSAAIPTQQQSHSASYIATLFLFECTGLVVLETCFGSRKSRNELYEKEKDGLLMKGRTFFPTVLQMASSPADEKIRLPGTPYTYYRKELRAAGIRAYLDGRLKLAHEYLFPLAKTGDAEAQFRVAIILTRRFLRRKKYGDWPPLNDWLPSSVNLYGDAPEDIASGLTLLSPARLA